MFSTANALPPISALTSEHPPPPLSSPLARPIPTGGCRFVLLHPSIHNQRCSCQCFHPNGKPGSICDCGHPSCYHAHTQPLDSFAPALAGRSTVPGLDPTSALLMERIQRLEQALTDEKRIRAESLQQDHQLREGQYQNVQQALRAGAKRERETREKLIELEDRVEGNYDEQVRTVERLIAVDDATMLLEKRLDDLDDNPKPKRKRLTSPQQSRIRKTRSEPRSFGDPSNHGDALHQPGEAGHLEHGTIGRPEACPRPEEDVSGSENLYPRSSGILDTSKMPQSLPLHPSSPYGIDSPPPSPRSSGVLDLSTLPPLSQSAPATAEEAVKGEQAKSGPMSSPSPSPLFYNSLAPMFELDPQQQHRALAENGFATAITIMKDHQRNHHKMVEQRGTFPSLSSPSNACKSSPQLTTPPDDDNAVMEAT